MIFGNSARHSIRAVGTRSRSATAEEAAKELSRWIRVFTPMIISVSDQGSHFKKKVMEYLAENYGVLHKFVVAYESCANGTVERLCRDVLRASRALIS